MNIPFNKPYIVGNEISYISEAYSKGQLAGDGYFTKLCSKWLENNLNIEKSLLTHSCTAALEMSAILIDIKPGDEIIMPSYTFVSTANAFVLRGGIPVFVDIRFDTLNIDESKIEAAITNRTKAIVPVHYAGVSCEMDTIMKIAKKYNLFVIEDAAQGMMSKYNDKYLGSIGDFGALSFHETKNIISGEGGALLLNNKEFINQAEIIREKGTNRSNFFRGQVDKYTWINFGSSYLPGELISAFLWAQLEASEDITIKRMILWNKYHDSLENLEINGRLRRPKIPIECTHNAHMYYILLNSLDERTKFIKYLKKFEVNSVFHYIPLHSAPAGLKFGKCNENDMNITNTVSDCIVRLPLWVGMDIHMDYIINVIQNYFND